MEFISQFLRTFVAYGYELWWSVLLGFLLSGLFFEFIPDDLVEKYLSQKGAKPIFISSIVGIILPVCCFGSLPIAVTLRKKGARLGPVLAFLVATPATSISALIVCWKLLGGFFTFYIFCTVIVMGLVIGYVGNAFRVEEKGGSSDDCCHEEHKPHRTFNEKIKGAVKYAFITLPKQIGLELLLGMAIASLIVIYQPIQNFIRDYLTGALGYAFVIAVGLATYVCSTASVPMADALIHSGMSSGQGMAYLLVGPITSYGTILVIRKEFGSKILFTYLGIIIILSYLFGILFDTLIGV